MVRPAAYPGDDFIQLDFENGELKEDITRYDYVLLLDVLEHLSNPERFLVNCRYSMNSLKRPMFLISTGNVAFLGVRLLLAIGFFSYGEKGILDVTHKRLFTLSSFRRLLRDTGFEIGTVHGLGVPFQLVVRNPLGNLLSGISYLLARMWPSLFAYQFLIEATPKPNSYVLLNNAECFYGANRAAKSNVIV
jgi:hypothetical protein